MTIDCATETYPSTPSLICNGQRTRADYMKMTTWSNRFASWALLLSLTWMLCTPSIDRGWAQDKVSDAGGANAQAKDLLDLRGDLPNPRRIDASELHKLPRVEVRTTDPRDPGKEIIYSGTPLFAKTEKRRWFCGQTSRKLTARHANDAPTRISVRLLMRAE